MHFHRVDVDEAKNCNAFSDTHKAIHAAASWYHISWHWRSGWIGGTFRKACECFLFSPLLALYVYIYIISVGWSVLSI